MFNSHEEVDSMAASNELKTRPAQPCESPFASAGGLTMHGIASGPKVSCSVVFSFKTPNLHFSPVSLRQLYILHQESGRVSVYKSSAGLILGTEIYVGRFRQGSSASERDAYFGVGELGLILSSHSAGNVEFASGRVRYQTAVDQVVGNGWTFTVITSGNGRAS